MVDSELAIFEESEDGAPTGVELEQLDDENFAIKNPWDPNKIRVDPKTFSLKTLLELIASGELDLAPDFQRRNVWKPIQKSRLIESVFLRIPLPAFYFSSADDGSMQVVDGMQRLSAIRDFADNRGEGFPLQGLEYLQSEVGGKRHSDLNGTLWMRRFNQTQVFANVIDPQTPDQVKFDIFKRINTGGSPLNAQEIRHCMSGKRSRNFIKELTELDVFNIATNHKLKNSVRMVDREVVLRYIAFKSIIRLEEYAETGTMDGFLTEATRKLDKSLTRYELEILKNDFERSMSNAVQLFGEYAFRKWPLDNDRILPFNRALFDVLSVVLADFSWSELKPRKAKIIKEFRTMMTNDYSFLYSISQGTGDPNRVYLRFACIRELIGRRNNAN